MPLPADIALTTIDGRAATLADFNGKVLLIVNVASQCGFTPQYAGLEELHRKYASEGFAVLGFPCNQFGHQEPGDAAEIKISAHQLRRDLPDVRQDRGQRRRRPSALPIAESEAPGLLGTKAIKWNFTKFLVDRRGKVVGRYAPATKPEKLARDIEAALDQARAQA